MRFERWQGRSPLELFPVSIGLLGACVVFFLATDVLHVMDKSWGVNEPAAFARGEFWRPVTSMFLHGGLLHLLLNSYAFWMLCPSLEAEVGSAKFAAVYFGAGIVGSLASLSFEWASLGASGAICGVMATYLRFERVRLGSFRAVMRDPVASQFLVWLGINIALGFFGGAAFGGRGARVSNAGHIGGVIGGWAMSAALFPALKGANRGRIAPKISVPKLAAVLAGMAAMVVADLHPVWNASYCAQAAVDAAIAGNEAKAMDLVAKMKKAPLAKEPGLAFRAAYRAIEEGHPAVGMALVEAGLGLEAFDPDLAEGLEDAQQPKALLAYLRAWNARLKGLPEPWPAKLKELEALEARGELR